MNIKYLGTGASEGWPAVFCSCANCERARERGKKDLRTRSQVLIDNMLLIDLGPDTYIHSLMYGINLNKIRSCLITHSHQDHFYPEDLIFKAEPYGHFGYENSLTIYGNSKVLNILNYMKQLYNDSDNFDQCVNFNQVNTLKRFETLGYSIVPLPAKHDSSEECFIYDITSLKDKKRLLYGNDTAYFPEETLNAIKDTKFDLISLDCTMGGNKSCETHMSLMDCIELKNHLNNIGCAHENTVFSITHFSHNGGLLHDELTQIAKKHGIIVAYDGLEIEI